MEKDQRTPEDVTFVLRGFALALGLLANMPFVLYLVSSGAKDWPALAWTEPQEAPLFLALTVALLGYLVAWRWPRVGGAVTTASAVAICALVFFSEERAHLPAALLLGIPMFVSGILSLVCRRRSGHSLVPNAKRDATGSSRAAKLTQATKAS